MKKTERILNTLNECIEDLCKEPQKFLVNPQKDFTRHRKLGLETVIQLCPEFCVNSKMQ